MNGAATKNRHDPEVAEVWTEQIEDYFPGINANMLDADPEVIE